jgi:hypothetical protein
MSGIIISAQVLSGGQSQKVVTSTASAQTAVLTETIYTVTSDTNCFMRMGLSPVALADGTDQIILANQTYRLQPIIPGQKLAFILAVGTGNVYLSPNA